MARASIAPRLLSLDRWARLFGLDPLHFNGAYSELRPTSGCNDVWFQYDWQAGDRVSREQLAACIDEAERDLADALGYWPAPVWIADERQPYHQPQRADLVGTGYDARLRYKQLRTKWGYVQYGGQRATTLLDADATWTGVDADGDGYNELKRFTILNMDADLEPCEVKAYFKEYDVADVANTRTDPSSTGADPAWEVQGVQASLVGTTLTVYVPAWAIFRPQLWESYGATGIDGDMVGNYVDELSFYREYNDPTTMCTFLWGSDIYCSGTACSWVTQDGCFRVTDPRVGLIAPWAGTYEAATGSFSGQYWSKCREPDGVRLWYRAGYIPERTGGGCELLTHRWAEIIAMLAAARLDRRICSCSGAEAKVDYYRRNAFELAESGSFTLSEADLDNPFGMRVGEVLAYRQVRGRGRRVGRAINAYR